MCTSSNYVLFLSYTGYTALQWFKSHSEWKKYPKKTIPFFFKCTKQYSTNSHICHCSFSKNCIWPMFKYCLETCAFVIQGTVQQTGRSLYSFNHIIQVINHILISSVKKTIYNINQHQHSYVNRFSVCGDWVTVEKGIKAFAHSCSSI